MSLKLAAEHLKAHGRGEDTQLIHMTPGEVKGLQQLAERHGGSLTINPHTGLPEAGFLSNLLPTVLGVGVGIATGNPFIGAAVAGGLGYAQSGSLMSGIMSGLGAYSGYGLMNGLSAAAPVTGINAAEAAGGTALNTAGVGGNIAGQVSSQIGTGVNAFTEGAAGLGSNVAGVGGNIAGQVSNQIGQGVSAFNGGAGYGLGSAAKGAGELYANSLEPLSYTDRLGQTFSNAGSGISNLVSNPSTLGKEFVKNNYMGLLGAGSTVLGAIPTPKPAGPAGYTPDEYDARLAKYKLDPNFQASVPLQPNPYYKVQYPNYVANPYNPYAAAQGGVMQSYAEGGIAALAGGGDATNFMGQDMYPQSQQEHSFYSTPSQMPTSAQQTMASYEPNTNPLTGQLTANMAEGGIAGYAFGGVPNNSGSQVYYDAEKGQYYTQATPNGFLSGFGANIFNPFQFADNPDGNRTYLGSSLSGQDTFQAAPTITPNVYQPTYDAAAQMAQAASTPMQQPVQQPTYSLNDSLALLQATNPQIAAQYAAPSPTEAKKMNAGGATAVPQMHELPNYGINTDSDPNTRSLGPLAAAKYRLDKLHKRFGLSQPAQTEASASKGLSDVAPADLASGGIAGYNLGGYAAGGNPRLLKGPGDGMSDNIPAVIGDRQPARLADGEFVVPADVVSHLGNGSTDAGAKHLYTMMDKVRKARTGNKNQGKQINPAKFMPK